MKWSGDRAVSAGNSANPKEPRMKTLHTNAFKTGQWKTHRMWRRHRIKTMASNTAVATDAGFNKLLILAPNNRNSIVGRSIQHCRTSCCNWLISDLLVLWNKTLWYYLNTYKSIAALIKLSMKARGLGQSSLLQLEITQGVAGAKEKRDIWNTSENRWPTRRRVKFP